MKLTNVEPGYEENMDVGEIPDIIETMLEELGKDHPMCVGIAKRFHILESRGYVLKIRISRDPELVVSEEKCPL